MTQSFLSPSILQSFRVHAEQGVYRKTIRFPPIATIYDLSALRTLSLPGPTVEDIVRIGNFQKLKEFKIVGQLYNQSRMEASAAGSFTSLRILIIEDGPEMVTKWLPLFRNAKLVTLSISSSNDIAPYNYQMWRELFIALNKNIDHGSLRKLDIMFSQVPVPTLKASDILPLLLSFTELRSFSIHLRRSLPLSYDEMLELTKAWPHLTKVKFTPTSFEPEYYSKLSSLALWAENCPKLESLHLSVDASDRDDRLDLISRLTTPEFSMVRLSLTTLNIGRSPITHKEFVALFLLKIFPSLTNIINHGTGRRRWEKVVFLMSLMRASRDTSRETIEEGAFENLRHWWTERSTNRIRSDEESDS